MRKSLPELITDMEDSLCQFQPLQQQIIMRALNDLEQIDLLNKKSVSACLGSISDINPFLNTFTVKQSIELQKSIKKLIEPV